MKNYGYMRVAAAVPEVNVADVRQNIESISLLAKKAAAGGAKIVVFPEMSVTAYTCGDLFHSSTLLEGALSGLEQLCRLSTELNAALVVGAPIRVNNSIYNCAVVIAEGTVKGVVPKTYLPNYNEFYEKRWFASWDEPDTIIELCGNSYVPFGKTVMFEINSVKTAIEICEDLWAPIPPSCHHALNGAELILNLSASNDLIGKYDYLMSLIKQQSARCISAYVYSSAGYGESTTDLVFDGKAIIAENGSILASNSRWNNEPSFAIADVDIEALRRDRFHIMTFNDCAKIEQSRFTVESISLPEEAVDGNLLREIKPEPFVPEEKSSKDSRCEEIINIQTHGLMKRLQFTHCKNLVVGISGGLDSTLALLVAARTFDTLKLPREGILGITMPGFGTTDRTYTNALTLMQSLGVTIKEISIAPAVKQHFSDIGHDINVHDVTYENSQARERTQLLMDIANQVNGMVLGTGDLSELALGWATYNGDHMSMYGVNAGVPKTLVKHLVRWFAETSDNDQVKTVLYDIIDTPISPELIPADSAGNITQKTEDLVGPYELHDFFLYYTLRYGFSPKKIYYLATHAFSGKFDDETIKKWIRTFFRRFFAQQFKRSCLPDGPKVGSVCLSPRGDWRMPSDASSALWLKECDEL